MWAPKEPVLDSNFLGFGIIEDLNKATKNRDWLIRLILWFFIIAGILWRFNYAVVPSLKGLFGVFSSYPVWLAKAATYTAYPAVSIALVYLFSRLVAKREAAKMRKQWDEIDALRQQVDSVLERGFGERQEIL